MVRKINELNIFLTKFGPLKKIEELLEYMDRKANWWRWHRCWLKRYVGVYSTYHIWRIPLNNFYVHTDRTRLLYRYMYSYYTVVRQDRMFEININIRKTNTVLSAERLTRIIIIISAIYWSIYLASYLHSCRATCKPRMGMQIKHIPTAGVDFPFQ